MYGPPHDCKRKAEGEEKQSASMYPAFGWRSALLAMMSFAGACSYKPNGRKRPLCLADFRHAVVTVLSSLLLLCRLRWVNFKPSSWCGKVGARSASKPQASFPRRYAVTGLYSLPLESTAQAIRASLLAMATTTTFLGALASSASSQAPIGARSRLIRSTAARAP